MFASSHSLARTASIIAGALALSAVAGLAFAGWVEQAPDMFLTLVEQGLSWCF